MAQLASFSRYNVKTGMWEEIESYGDSAGVVPTLREFAYTKAELEETVENLRLSKAKAKVKSQPPPPMEDKEEVSEEEIDVERFRRLSNAKV